jgi:5-(aminomethyl)-3-furanmethanol phosphate kinase
VTATNEQRLRVVKLGGSLLDLPDLIERLRRWLASQGVTANVLLIGGGRLVDVLRDYDVLHSLNDGQAHWLAIRAMQLQARMIASLLPEATWFDGPPRQRMDPLAILDPFRFLQIADRQHPSGPLPQSWNVTSDSIAARAADLLGADELVLLKSALPLQGATREAAMTAHYVDPHFLEASRPLQRIRCVDLRDDSFREISLR